MKLTDIIKALWQAPQSFAPTAAGNDAVTIPALARSVVVTISPGAGVGAYTRIYYTPVANRVAGDVVWYRIRMPASVNPTVELRDASAGGTLIKTVAGTGTAFDVVWPVVYGGSAWA